MGDSAKYVEGRVSLRFKEIQDSARAASRLEDALDCEFGLSAVEVVAVDLFQVQKVNAAAEQQS